MSYALHPSESMAAGLRRIANEQVERALEGLRAAADDRARADAGIHDARKRFKKVRAVLRLVRKDLGKGTYRRENEAWRDAGRLLADVRESAVAPRTVEALVDEHRNLLKRGPFREFTQRLHSRHEDILDAVRSPGGALEKATEIAEEGRSRIPAWPVPHGGFEAMEASLEKVYRRGRNRMSEAFEAPSGPRFHEWRKRVKYLWYHLRILVPSWPDILKPWAATQHDLADLLGDGNDLTDLLALMAEESELVPDPDVASVLDGLARARRQALWEAARPLGRRLYSEEPGAFVARLADYWDGKSPVEPGDLQIGT